MDRKEHATSSSEGQSNNGVLRQAAPGPPIERVPPLRKGPNQHLPAVRTRILFGIIASWTYKGVAVLANLVNTYLLFHYLPKETLGLWYLMIGAQAFVGILDFGFSQTLQRRIAFAKGADSADPAAVPGDTAQSEIRDMLALGRRVYVAISVAVLLCLLIVGEWYFANLDMQGHLREEMQQIWVMVCVGYAANSWGFYVESALNGLGDIGWSSIISATVLLLATAGNWAVLTTGLGLMAVACVWIAKGLLTRALGWRLILARHAWVRVPGAEPNLKTLKSMVPPSLKWWAAILGYFLMTGITQYLIGIYLGPQAVPAYVATYMALSTLAGLMVGTVTVGTPLFSQLIRADKSEDVRKMIKALGKISLGALGAGFAIVLVYGRDIFELWLGKGNYVGLPVASILILMMMLEAHQGMLQPACVAAEKLGFYKANILGGMLSLAFSLILLPQFGLLGAALGVMFGQAATQNWVIPAIGYKVLNMTLLEDLKSIILPSLMLTSVSALTALLFHGLFDSPFVGPALSSILMAAVMIMIWKKRVSSGWAAVYGLWVGRRG